jgi:iron complex transport system permease protein
VIRRGPLSLYALASAAVLGSFALALLTGSVAVPAAEVLRALLGRPVSPVVSAIVLELRLPRALLAFAVGGLLALAGAELQVLLRNPLADPYVLGVSGGAAAAALAGILAGAGFAAVMGDAFVGALVATLLVVLLARLTGPLTPLRLLLTGAVFAAGANALCLLLLSLARAPTLESMLFWLMGGIHAYGTHPLLLLGLLGAALAVLLLEARRLDILLRGPETARALGVRVGALAALLYASSALLTAAAVTEAGMIGFVGLLVPHFARLLGGAGHRRVLPLSALLGGSLLLAAETLAHSALAPRLLPVGVVTALLGVPLFLLLLSLRETAWTP